MNVAMAPPTAERVAQRHVDAQGHEPVAQHALHESLGYPQRRTECSEKRAVPTLTKTAPMPFESGVRRNIVTAAQNTYATIRLPVRFAT